MRGKFDIGKSHHFPGFRESPQPLIFISVLSDGYMILQIAFIHSLRVYIAPLVFLPRDGKSLSDPDGCAISFPERRYAAG
jgi:hypothetical protein